MDKFIESNRKLWDEWADLHVNTKFYDVEGFKNQEAHRGMRPLEIKELGDVTGKKLLHFQCHFGMDTLSWERLGAEPIGIDFSERAIYHANQLTKELGMNSKFVQCDIYNLQNTNLEKESFDIVYTSHGV